jgi:hypothetical protein
MRRDEEGERQGVDGHDVIFSFPLQESSIRLTASISLLMVFVLQVLHIILSICGFSGFSPSGLIADVNCIFSAMCTYMQTHTLRLAL